MSKFLVEGGVKLQGKVNIGGFKNAALAIVPAALLSRDVCIIENVPMIEDIHVLSQILETLGAEISQVDETTMKIDATNVKEINVTTELSRKIRGSYYLLGVGLGLFNHVNMPLPGGCNIGKRPIDLHIKGFEVLGGEVSIEGERISVDADNLTGNKIYLDFASVGATINIMLAAVYAEGKTVIENAAKEPHIVDTANFLSAMGADIKGAGTDIIRINGVEKLTGCTYSVIPDQIEAGTYMVAAAATKGDILIDGIIPKHLEPITAKLTEMGMIIEEYGDSLRVTYKDELKAVNIKTLPYPGFPTDLQQPFAVLLATIAGECTVEETIYEDRMKYVEELKKMGAGIDIVGRIAYIHGKDKLKGTPVIARDLRAGAAMIVAGLVAEGITEIREIAHIDRGYESIEKKFMNLGARIRRVD